MRDALMKTLTDIARVDKNLILLTADMGFGVLTEFARIFPQQFLNVGIAEQNMAGIATGLALEGKTVFTYSISNFPTLRCVEQIRNDICFHNANVKIVSIGGGFCYGALGISHHATEDLAIMRALPNMSVVAPGDAIESSLATRSVYETPGPCYLRLGRGGEPKIHDKKPNFALGKAIAIFEEGNVALLATGGILFNVVKAREILKLNGVNPSVYSFHSLRPFDHDLIEYLSKTAKLIVTVEEHSLVGGLGGAVAEVLSGFVGPKPPLLRIGLSEGFSCDVGDQEYLRVVYGLSPSSIAQRVQETVVRLTAGGSRDYVIQSKIR